ncbi:MAG: alkaline phosphatase [Bacteroidales bacterium]|nr:alkaline phosphatase [Bacteroidales bacterium]MCR5065219.1 alkaline phosphatase [Bacteroidales bacterium]
MKVTKIILASVLAFTFSISKPLCAQQTVATTDRILESDVPGQWLNEPPAVQSIKKAKNVIIIIGDGMGTAQVYASIVAQKDASNFLRFPYSGFSRTYSHNKYTTDSGAGGTAIVTGHKTDNRHIGVLPDGTPVPSFLSLLHDRGLSTGFVVTSSVLDATPASTYAHAPDRKMFDTISLHMSQCGFDVMIGGGLSNFRPENRKDGLSPLDTLRKRGYEITYSLEEMKQSKSNKLVTFFCENYYGPVAPGRDPVLTEGTKKALEILTKNPKGFAMMIEGSQIDWGCHNNDAAYMEAELADFEKMLKIVLDFAEKDGNTLVVVTADHETGGLVLTGGDIANGKNTCKYITDGHSGVMVPVFAFGPGAETFSGIQQNIDLLPKVFKAMGKDIKIEN